MVTSKKRIEYINLIENNTLRIEASRRGGGIEVDASSIFGDNAKISAYQNYLGGGLLGSIQSDYNFIVKEKDKDKLQALQEVLKQYFHNITNEEAGNYDEWNSASFESVQKRPESAY